MNQRERKKNEWEQKLQSIFKIVAPDKSQHTGTSQCIYTRESYLLYTAYITVRTNSKKCFLYKIFNES